MVVMARAGSAEERLSFLANRLGLNRMQIIHGWDGRKSYKNLRGMRTSRDGVKRGDLGGCKEGGIEMIGRV